MPGAGSARVAGAARPASSTKNLDTTGLQAHRAENVPHSTKRLSEFAVLTADTEIVWSNVTSRPP